MDWTRLGGEPSKTLAIHDLRPKAMTAYAGTEIGRTLSMGG
jgi:hypothetical protein